MNIITSYYIYNRFDLIDYPVTKYLLKNCRRFLPIGKEAAILLFQEDDDSYSLLEDVAQYWQ